jgi:Big-like domain-containing protein
MARTAPEGPPRVHHLLSVSAKVATAAAALATVLGYVHSVGLDGATTRRTVGTLGARWVGVTPATDTMSAVGDSLHLAATVTDRHGTALVGATITWTSSDTTIVSIDDGVAVGRAPGRATVVAGVGELLARASIVVRQRVAAVHLARDSALIVPEGSTRAVSMQAADARGHILIGRSAVWRSADTSVAAIDTAGRITALAAGHTVVSANVDGVTAQAPVTIMPLPGALAIVSGNGQDGVTGGALAAPVVVRLTSQRGRALPAAVVRFRRVDAAGSVELASTQTDGDGKARIAWRLGDIPGRQHLIATVEGLDSSVVADAEAEPVAANTRSAPLNDGQSAPIATALPEHVGIRLTDSSGRPLADVPVTWAALDGGSVTPATSRSDSLGGVEASWVLGPIAGQQRLRGSIGNGRLVKPVLVRARAVAGPAFKLTVLSGAQQHGLPGAALARPVVLKVSDAVGNAVPNVRIALRPAAGTVTDSAPTTDSSGVARLRWVMPVAGAGAAGLLHLSARVDGVVQTADVVAAVAAAAKAAAKAPSRPSPHVHAHRS